MSNQERDPLRTVRSQDGFERLERAVEAASARVRGLNRSLSAAQAETRRLEAQLQRFTGGEETGSELLARLQRLEAENEVLHDRLKRGREGVEKLLARVRFLEEQG